jgi:hypothetical protein
VHSLAEKMDPTGHYHAAHGAMRRTFQCIDSGLQSAMVEQIPLLSFIPIMTWDIANRFYDRIENTRISVKPIRYRSPGRNKRYPISQRRVLA